jgi:glycosyltransferase involved in cell wall biosynthesis
MRISLHPESLASDPTSLSTSPRVVRLVPAMFGVDGTLSAGKCVEFYQHCDDAALIGHYRRAICVVLPSVYRTMYGDETAVPELLGQTLLEGMACGLLAICTAVANLPEVIEDGVTGFVVPPNDPAALGERPCWLRDQAEAAAAMRRCDAPPRTRAFHLAPNCPPLPRGLRKRNPSMLKSNATVAVRGPEAFGHAAR